MTIFSPPPPFSFSGQRDRARGELRVPTAANLPLGEEEAEPEGEEEPLAEGAAAAEAKEESREKEQALQVL